MRKLILPAAITVSIASGAITGHAQQTAPGQKDTSPTQSQGAGGSDIRAMSQSRLREALQKAGFTDVRIVDAQYMVEAKTSGGEPVVMFINPPSVQGATATGVGAGTGSGTASGGATTGTNATPGTKPKQ